MLEFKVISTSTLTPEQLEEQMNQLAWIGWDWCGTVTFKSTPTGGPYSAVILKRISS